MLAYLPMAWIGQNIFSYAQWLVCGFTVNCPESAATVTADMREIGPTYYFAPPRVLRGTADAGDDPDGGRLARSSGACSTISWRLRAASARRLLDKQPVGVGDRLLYALGNLLVYAPLRNSLGMTRVRVAYTAGEAIGPDLFTFYRSLGINLKQLYGSTETSVFVCVQPKTAASRPTPSACRSKGVEIKLTDAGEILIRSPGLFQEYYKAPEATPRRRMATAGSTPATPATSTQAAT